jgi:hypothetical protein
MHHIILKQGVSLGLVVAAIAAPLDTSQCTREKLLGAADAYVAAQTSGTLVDLQRSFAPGNFSYMENNRLGNIKDSHILSQPLKIDYRRSTADTVACASYTELVATSPVPYVIGTQIRHNSMDMSINMIDSIAATTGALFFNASQTLAYFKNESWAPLEVSQRSDRKTLQNAIDSYLDLWSSPSAYESMPWSEPCERIEGSMYVSPCTKGAPTNGTMKPNTMRRYVIDEVMGSADAFCSFTSVGDIPDSHEVRLEGGKLRYVHTITLCAISNAGGNWGPTQCQGNKTMSFHA